MIEAGKLNKQITFSRSVITPGVGVSSWTTVCTVWGALRPLVGSRRFQAMQLNSEIQGQLIIRYRKDITASMRFTMNNRTFQILSIINPDESNEALEIDYKELLD